MIYYDYHSFLVCARLSSRTEVKKIPNRTEQRAFTTWYHRCYCWREPQLRSWNFIRRYLIYGDSSGLTNPELKIIDQSSEEVKNKIVNLPVIRSDFLRESDIGIMINRLLPTISKLAYQLRYVSLIEPSNSIKDTEFELISYAIRLIYIYEPFRNADHLVNTVKSSLVNYKADICKKWNADKRCGKFNRIVSKDSDGNLDYENYSSRSISDCYSDTLHFSENISNGIFHVNTSIVNFVNKFSDKRYVRYLSYLVLDSEDVELNEYIEKSRSKSSTFDSDRVLLYKFFRFNHRDLDNMKKEYVKYLNGGF